MLKASLLSLAIILPAVATMPQHALAYFGQQSQWENQRAYQQGRRDEARQQRHRRWVQRHRYRPYDYPRYGYSYDHDYRYR